jgi:hypothetical protein
MPPGELDNAADALDRAYAVAGSPHSLVHELLKQIRAGLALQIAGGGSAHYLAAGLSVAMIAPQGVDEDRGVVQKAPHAPGHLRIGASSISRL